VQYEVITFGNPELRVQSKPVEVVDDATRELARDMLRAMYRNNGLGLAAQQVGRSEALCVIDIPEDAGRRDGAAPSLPLPPMPLVLINPQITARAGSQVGQEGCLSFPDIYVNVKRDEEVTVEFLGLDGKAQSIRAAGLLSRAIQHELDHLDGVLLVDRMTPVQKVAVSGKLKRLKKQVRS